MNVMSENNPVGVIESENQVFSSNDQCGPLRNSLKKWDHFGPGQTAGRFFPIACVALEIVQRCNLDCTSCYLSHAAEMAHDVPLPVIFSRIDMIKSHFGPGTFIQITGGDPTLRSVEDLERICRYIRILKMNSCLMTNGIKVTDEMLMRLATAGLNDIAFHVDITQQRRGYSSEISLNSVRLSYIVRARRAGLRVLFNTTVFVGNYRELPILAQFFRENSAEVALTSFQLQANTGRGVVCERDAEITQASVIAALKTGMQIPLDFDIFAIGHPSCTRYASVLGAGDKIVSAASDRDLFHDLVVGLDSQAIRTGAYLNLWASALRLGLQQPMLALRVFRYGLGRLWALRGGLWSSRGKVHRMAVLVHDFMDANNLQTDRCETCIFMVATEGGPISMCAHNAKRDHYIFEPAQYKSNGNTHWWSAATGRTTPEPDLQGVGDMPYKRLKGRMRAAANAKRSGGRI